MSSGFRDALRERLTLRALFSWLAVLAIFHFFLESTGPQLAITTLTTVSAGLTDLVSDVYNLRKSVTNAGLGIQMIISASALLVFDDGTMLFPAAFFAIGGWFILNAVQTVRHEGATVSGTSQDGHDVYRDYVARRVYDILDDRPQTRRELDESLESEDAVVDAAIDRLLDNDAIQQVGSEFRISSSSDSGGITRIQRGTTGLIQRIARPILLEFEGERSDDLDIDRGGPRGTTIEGRTGSSHGTDSRTKHDNPGPREGSVGSNRQRKSESTR